MKAAVWVRVAAGLVFLHAVLHTIGGVFGKVESGPATAAVTAMKANQLMAFGSLRTYWDFYLGLGLAVSLFLTMEAVVLWLLAPLATSHGEKLRPVLGVFGAGYVLLAVVSFRYFFVAPAIFEVLIAVCLVGAAVTSRREAVDAVVEGRRLAT